MRRKCLIVLNSGAALESIRQYKKIKQVRDDGKVATVRCVYSWAGKEYVCSTLLNPADISYVANLMSKKPFVESPYNSHWAKKKAIQAEVEAMRQEGEYFAEDEDDSDMEELQEEVTEEVVENQVIEEQQQQPLDTNITNEQNPNMNA